MSLVKVSDFVARFLVEQGICDLFLVSGGGIMHLLDSVGRQERLRYWCTHHEQASAIAAEGLAKCDGSLGCCLVTVGPGGLNALSGIAGAWMDSTPVLVLSGQVRRDLIADYGQVRQRGPQEANLVGLAQGLTKYAVTVLDPAMIRFELEKALHLATTGRPGPVWIDLPLDVQGAFVEETALKGFIPETTAPGPGPAGESKRVLQQLQRARRPLVIAGNGLRRGKAMDRFMAFLERSGLPVLLPFSAKDLLPEGHPQNMGIFGTAGQRRAHFALQNADCLLSLASGLCVAKTGFNVAGFAPKAFKILVDIDPGQLHHQPLKPDLAVEAEVGAFLEALLGEPDLGRLQPDPRWPAALLRWKDRYPPLEPAIHLSSTAITPYAFMDALSDGLAPGATLVTGNGMDIVSMYQSFRVSSGQRIITTANWGAMGWDLPLALGAAIARPDHPTVLVTGDGSLMLNLQELATVQHHQLPLKLFVFNNQGYASIRATQNAFFDGRHVGADAASGVGLVDYPKLAQTFGLAYHRLADPGQLGSGIAAVLAEAGACLCEVLLPPGQVVAPKASAVRREDGSFESRPLEDMEPFLPREEIWENMHLFDPDPTS